ncbi:protoporphyrinogen oxidase [Paenisporosarcina sp. TG20]|uniref:protoporphyrinogen oxidase n=1 Tax=Paenisporosarcina sp. TG20 TaxID=1211706 RepID=UPI000318338E|nr:protoporphyrinogen oxidase [Paenisporosarcina sp. TG20]
MVQEKRKVAVVGGGITGLAAAYYMQKEAKEKGYALEVVLIEASHRLGGKIQTVRKNGFIIERGPDSFLARKKSFGILADDLGISDQLVSNATGQAYVLVNDELHPIPGGSVMGIPTQIAPFVTSGLFSWSGKFRAAGDFFLSKSTINGDQSLGQFFRRRFGGEVVENLIEPLLSGIYAGDIDKLSLKATFPQFYEIEQKHRSLILGMKKTTPKVPVRKPKEALFRTFKNGLETIVDAIETQLEPGSVIKGVRVDRLEKVGDQVNLYLNNGSEMLLDGVILTTPHPTLVQLFEEHDLLTGLQDMPATSVATVAMAFPEKAVSQDKEGTGFVVSRNSDYSITACTWTHRKWPTTTPEGHVLLRGYVGRAGDESVVDLSDSEIEKVVLADLRKTTKIEGDPLFTVVTRWKEAMPQYIVGHKERIAKAKQEVHETFPMVKLAGSSLEGLGLPDCIDQGKAAVTEILEDFYPKNQ